MDENVQVLDLSDGEKQLILEALNLLVKSTDNALAAAQKILPVAAKVSQSMTPPKQG